ncbi:serine hydrolase domain-containing protein [Pseudoxanthomonas sacheonensis]|uniref:serine hydrolase domain-containing protein n=1 Tax=Pseudoxanthomonas sacheonensis TaxID=443615 RepID=UPI0013D75B5D|nr:serine hydrolase domain-containing protein [Pseudoxanthomonas sacheonensis]KAF1706108.1 serine hydrolase [Pseudoxanthomonas sacheonensis]
MPAINRRQLLLGSLSLPLLALPSAGWAQVQTPRVSFESLLRPTVHSGNERWELTRRMSHYGVPGVAVAVLRDGRTVSLKGYGSRLAGHDFPIGPDTLFSVGSVSKVATAALCLKLVALGKLDLDQGVDHWLRRWRLPQGLEGDTSDVSLRMLLSHTAGFNVHGFKDVEPSEPLPSLVQTLNGVLPALNKPLQRIDRAGSRSRYSGGGYMVAQAVIEDAMGQAFDALARRYLFAPLGMGRSRFDAAPSAATADIAHAHDGSGKPVALPRGWQSFPELAPSGLWTSARDLARLVEALCASYRKSGGFLPQALAIDMMTAVSPGTFGLGPRLAGEGSARIFHHAGANDSYKAYIEGNLDSGDGLVIVANGVNGDVLGDEIRNAVSDSLEWPGDWSVKISPVAAADLLDEFVGAYKRRADQSPELMGILDTSFDIQDLTVLHTPDGLELQAKGKRRPLKPVSSNRFVAPDSYIPAGTLQIAFNRGAVRGVKSLTIVAGGGVLVFDKQPVEGQESD